MRWSPVWSALALIAQALPGIGGAGVLYGQNDLTLNTVRAESNGISVEVDPRIELMAVIQILADYPILTSHVTPYRADVSTYFDGYREHDAVAVFRSMAEAGFAFDAVPKAFASMSSLPELALGAGVPAEVVDRAGGSMKLEHFAELAGDFAQDSKFAAFFDAHEGTYRSMVDSTFSAVVTAVDQLTEYTGFEFAAARVVLSPLLHDGGFAMTGGDPDAQAFIGPMGIGNGGFPDFGDPQRLGPLLWHEFSHVMINPLTERAGAAVDELEIHDSAFREQMRRNAYVDWNTIVSESIIRALEVRLAARVLGVEVGQRIEGRQVGRGFRHVPALAEALKEYETDRTSYPTLGAFFPQLLRVFK